MTPKAEVPLDINENFLSILKICHSIISSNGCPLDPTKSKHSLPTGKCTQKLHKFFSYFATSVEIGKLFHLIL